MLMVQADLAGIVSESMKDPNVQAFVLTGIDFAYDITMIPFREALNSAKLYSTFIIRDTKEIIQRAREKIKNTSISTYLWTMDFIYRTPNHTQ